METTPVTSPTPGAVRTRSLSPASAWPGVTIEGGGGLRVPILAGGWPRGVWAGDVLVSRLLAGPVGGGMMRLFLRRLRGGGVIDACEAVGKGSSATWTAGGHEAVWSGAWCSVAKPGKAGASETKTDATFTIRLVLDTTERRWAWQVRVDGLGPDAWDAVLVQDVGLAHEGLVRNNEKYVSQYLDHRVLSHADAGPVVMSRQALAQGGAHPWLLSTATRGVAAMTDGVAFYGPVYKTGQPPAHLFDPELPNGVIQHESAAAVLQARPEVGDSGSRATATFAFAFTPDHPDASSEADLDGVDPLLAWARSSAASSDHDLGGDGPPAPAPTRCEEASPLRSGEPATEADLESWFGPCSAWRNVEQADAGVLSFFHGPDRHVATFQKDADLRRGHGHILRTGQAWMPAPDTLGMTCYQHGVFASQVTLGNTTFGQITGVARDELNLDQLSGLRVSVDLEDGEGFVQLAEASAFEMAPGWARWWYRLGGRVLTVRAVASPDETLLRFSLRVVKGGAVRARLTQHLCIGEQEDCFETDVHFDTTTGVCTATPSPKTRLAQTQPGTRFALSIDRVDDLCRFDAIPFDPESEEAGCYPYLVVETEMLDAFAWSLAGATKGNSLPADLSPDPAASVDAADAYWAELRAPLTRLIEGRKDGVPESFVDLPPWFVHNAMIHLSLPHGLEQFGGAAWGTRDVCQGPVEMLRAIERPDVIAEILRVVFKHQFRQNGNWPQWFMHEPYQAIQAGESHGDVVVWPMYAVCHYLEMTGDTSLLDEAVTYTEHDRAAGFPFSNEQHAEPIRAHIDRALERIASQHIPGTVLPRYGDGDWNDSLQPAEPWMAERMVSSWTVALLQHTLSRLSEAVRGYDASWSEALAARAAAVAQNFQRWCVIDGQVAGIVLFNEDQSAAEPLLHPHDERTGIRHSLIPMNRGLLGGLFSDEQAAHHLAVMRETLAAPDGMRLMERPPTYTGGHSRFFQRAESAAFFGREIGLMYTHAHLRTAEVMIERGLIDEALRLLDIVNPVGLPGRVSNAERRQGNAYFSSSDAGFASRFDADTDHEKVYTGDVTARGGWRIYSSGPGIYLWLLRRCLEADA